MENQETLERVEGVAEELLQALERAVGELGTVTATRREKVKTQTGEQVTEYQKVLPEEPGTVDRGGLKQLTAVLKDIREIFAIQSSLEKREQEARIARLERELSDQCAQPVTVCWEEGVEDYAE